MASLEGLHTSRIVEEKGFTLPEEARESIKLSKACFLSRCKVRWQSRYFAPFGVPTRQEQLYLVLLIFRAGAGLRLAQS